MGIPLTICDYRDKKILKHFFVTPASPGHLIATQVLSSYDNGDYFCRTRCIGVPSLSIIEWGNWLLLIASYFLVMIAMYSLGLLIASLCKNMKIANLVYSLFISDALYLAQ